MDRHRFRERIETLFRSHPAVGILVRPHGAELDVLIVRGRGRLAFEFKYSSAPKATRSMYSALDDLALDHLTIVCPGSSSYPLSARITVTNLADLATRRGDRVGM